MHALTEKSSSVCTSELLDDRWFVLYKLAKPFPFTVFQAQLAAL